MEAIVAVYTDWGIGSEGTQPIVVPEDRRRFAEITKGATLIVGSKTLLDFPESQPLKGRRNLIMTRQDTAVDGAEIVHTPEEALELCGDDEQVFVVGGATVYMSMFPYLDKIYVTKIDATPASDAYFPNLDSLPDWEQTSSEKFSSGGQNCEFCVYEKVK